MIFSIIQSMDNFIVLLCKTIYIYIYIITYIRYRYVSHSCFILRREKITCTEDQFYFMETNFLVISMQKFRAFNSIEKPQFLWQYIFFSTIMSIFSHTSLEVCRAIFIVCKWRHSNVRCKKPNKEMFKGRNVKYI